MPLASDRMRKGDGRAALRPPRLDRVAGAEPVEQRQPRAERVRHPAPRKARAGVGHGHLELPLRPPERDVDAAVRPSAVRVHDRVRADLRQHQLEVVELLVAERQAGGRSHQRLARHRKVTGVGRDRQRCYLFQVLG